MRVRERPDRIETQGLSKSTKLVVEMQFKIRL